MSSTHEARVAIRVDRDLKLEADELFRQLGINMTSAVNMFLRKAVAEKAIPFEVSIQGNVLAGKYAPNEILALANAALEQKIIQAQQSGAPIARYDAQNQRAYLEFSDGGREYIDA